MNTEKDGFSWWRAWNWAATIVPLTILVGGLTWQYKKAHEAEEAERQREIERRKLHEWRMENDPAYREAEELLRELNRVTDASDNEPGFTFAAVTRNGSGRLGLDPESFCKSNPLKPEEKQKEPAELSR